ncbi:MAG: isopenicillin N synthase family oxygenase [Rhizobiaceae bacterium]|jgi:isopenicillin N synthase-like dioxygenase|nr:isopenicillin N synthase family oxygenase [Rhizobiaceae bacterium]
MSDFNVLAIAYDDPDAGVKFSKSLHETGFAILKGHPISKNEIDQMYKAWSNYFTKDDRFKDAVQPGEVHGYYGYKSENAKGSAQKDLKEFYHVYESKPVPADVESETRSFQKKMIAIGAELLDWLDNHMPSETRSKLSQSLTDMISGSEHNLLRVLHYPPLPDNVEAGEVRAAAHEDINLITLLVTGSEPGLQAKDSKGDWHDVPCNSGYITINSGDMLSKATGGYYPSTPHRVVNPPDQENRSRYSMPLFVHPRPEVQLDEKQTAGEYLDERLREIGLK